MENYLISCSRISNRMILVCKGYVIQDTEHKVFVKVYKSLLTNDFRVCVFFGGKGWSIKRLSKAGLVYIGQPTVREALVPEYYDYDMYHRAGKLCKRTPDVFSYHGGSNDPNFVLDQIFDNTTGLGVTLL